MGILNEILTDLIRAEVGEWKVEATDPSGKIRRQDFDMLTLLGSFIESEMDLEFSFGLLEVVIQRLSKGPEKKALTHEDIHLTVVNALLDSPHPDALLWLSNYENIFGPDAAMEIDPNLINVRNAVSLKNALAEIYGWEFGETDLESKTDSQKHPIKNESSQIKEIVNRFNKLIRYCGFYVVDKDFLKIFVDEISARSLKGFLPRRTFDVEQVGRDLDHAERLLVAGREITSENRAHSAKFLELGLELAGEVMLSYFKLIPATANRNSFRHFLGFLDTFSMISKKQHILPRLQQTRNDIERAFKARGLNIETFKREGSMLKNALEGSSRGIEDGSVPAFVDAAHIALVLLHQIRLVVESESDLTKIMAFNGSSDEYSVYLSQVARVLEGDKENRAELSQDGTYLEIDITHDFHELIQFGRRLRVRALFGTLDELDNYEFQSEKQDCRESEDIIPVGVVEKGMGGTLFERYRALVTSTNRCVGLIYRNKFEEYLRPDYDLRDLVYQEFLKVFPQIIDRARVFDLNFEIPSNLPTVIASELKDLMRLASSVSTTAAIQATRMCESIVRDHAYIIYSLVLKYYRERVSKLLADWDEKAGLRSCVVWFERIERDCRGDTTLRKHLSALLPNARLRSRIEAIRETRNHFVHFHREIEIFEALQIISEIALIAAELNNLSSNVIERCLVQRRDSRMRIFIDRGDMVEVLDDLPIGPSAKTDYLGFISNGKLRVAGDIIPAYSLCSECKNGTPMKSLGSSRQFICSVCNKRSKIEGGPWSKVIHSRRKKHKA